jgi:hypothetical protein
MAQLNNDILMLRITELSHSYGTMGHEHYETPLVLGGSRGYVAYK